MPEYERLRFNCQVCGLPQFDWDEMKNYLPEVTLNGLKAIGIGYGVKAALDAWLDAGNAIVSDQPRWETGCVFGSSVGDTEVVKKVIAKGRSKKAGFPYRGTDHEQWGDRLYLGTIGIGQPDHHQFCGLRHGNAGYPDGL